jgi:glycosyltransferase involved in cell wall biosynthesis
LKKISILTASFQSESTILDTLRSVNMQTYENIEHIVVDGASKDRTLGIVQSEGKRVAAVVSERDNGIYDAYNKGLSLASGEIIGFLNSDDFYFSETVIEKIMAAFEDDNIDACYGDLIYVDRNDTNKITRYWKSRSYAAGIFKNGFVPAHPTLFLRRSVYEKAGGFNLAYRLAADYEFMLRIFHQLNIKSVYIPDILVKMRTGGATGESLTSIRKQNEEIMSALHQHGIVYSKVNFLLRKIIDRIVQRIRASFIMIDKTERFQ